MSKNESHMTTLDTLGRGFALVTTGTGTGPDKVCAHGEAHGFAFNTGTLLLTVQPSEGGQVTLVIDATPQLAEAVAAAAEGAARWLDEDGRG